MRTILGQRPAFDRTFIWPEDPESMPTGAEYAVGVEVVTVALVRKGIEWAAYYGHAPFNFAEVASNGVKLPEAAARALFPGVEERYRL